MNSQDDLNVSLKHKFTEIQRKKSVWSFICNKISLIIMFFVFIFVLWVVQVIRERLLMNTFNVHEEMLLQKVGDIYQKKITDLRARNHYYVEEASMTKAHLSTLKKDLQELKTTNERFRNTINDLENEVKQHTMSIIDINKKCNDLKQSIF